MGQAWVPVPRDEVRQRVERRGGDWLWSQRRRRDGTGAGAPIGGISTAAQRGVIVEGRPLATLLEPESWSGVDPEITNRRPLALLQVGSCRGSRVKPSASEFLDPTFDLQSFRDASPILAESGIAYGASLRGLE